MTSFLPRLVSFDSSRTSSIVPRRSPVDPTAVSTPRVNPVADAKTEARPTLRGLVLALAMLAPAGMGCQIIEGNGVSRNVHRDVPLFTSLELSGSHRVEARQGSPQSVSVSGDENLVDHMETVVDGSRLYIHEQNGVWLRPRLPLVVRVVVPDLAAVALSGSGQLQASGFRGGAVSATLSGSGEIELSDLDGGTVTASLSGSGALRLGGVADAVDIDVSGSGACKADCLQASVAQVTVSGSGDVDVCATERLSVDIGGSGAVRYTCDPRQIERNISGSGMLARR